MNTNPDKCPPSLSRAGRLEWEREQLVREIVIAELRKMCDEDVDWHAVFDELQAEYLEERQMREGNWRSDLADAALPLRMRVAGRRPSAVAYLFAREGRARFLKRLKAAIGWTNAAREKQFGRRAVGVVLHCDATNGPRNASVPNSLIGMTFYLKNPRRRNSR